MSTQEQVGTFESSGIEKYFRFAGYRLLNLLFPVAEHSNESFVWKEKRQTKPWAVVICGASRRCKDTANQQGSSAEHSGLIVEMFGQVGKELFWRQIGSRSES